MDVVCDLGVMGIRLGEKALLTFGPHYKYGARDGAPPFIPGNSTLVFDAELFYMIFKLVH
ncbi:hypothetical protein BO71DRAFT_488498 [Aspergillus ellipticus CBS 707.79]|uniref:peptidylprolyl isomerase n=1 Tax=Aspergillus ellipticus CBS 707.79 TaxID=1448320 RepID=A0A319D2S1_9EURO|nr:hypothetical protein BO71DRAFT_488498 [Aspergillus ellipticus CBS 707.79]